MRQVLNYITWGFIILFAAPTVMIIASWNSLPGDPLYGIKLGLEQALLVLVSPSFGTQGNLSVKYTEQRFSEAKRLLADKGSVEGLQYVDKQVTTTRDIIQKGNDTKVQTELAQKYIDTLTNLSAELDAQQQALVGTGPSQQVQQTPPPTQQQVFIPPSQPTSGQQQQTPSIQLQPTVPSSGQAGPTQPQIQPAVRAPQNQLPPPSVVTQQAQAPIQRPAPQPASAPLPPIVAAQISQTQANIAQTIKELEQVTKKSQQQEHKQEEKKEVPQAPQPQEQHKEEKGKGKE